MAASLQHNNKMAEPRPETREDPDECDGRTQPADSPEQMLTTMEGEIIPRLVRSLRGARPRPAPRNADTGPIEVVEFSALLLDGDSPEVLRYLNALHGNGVSVESLFLELMTPAARRLGCLWEEDLCSMIDVTLAVGRLHRAVREFSPAFQDQCALPDMRRRALLTPMPGEQHTFGLSLVMEFFRRAGWELWGWPLLGDEDLLRLVQEESFVFVGFSVGAEANLTHLDALIRDVRRASRNPALGIMLGGPLLLNQPRLAESVGADTMAIDAPRAVMQAESMLARR